MRGLVWLEEACLRQVDLAVGPVTCSVSTGDSISGIYWLGWKETHLLRYGKSERWGRVSWEPSVSWCTQATLV